MVLKTVTDKAEYALMKLKTIQFVGVESADGVREIAIVLQSIIAEASDTKEQGADEGICRTN